MFSVILIKCPGQTSHLSISKVIFLLSGFIRRVKQAQTFNFWTSTFEKISKILKLREFFRYSRPRRGHPNSKIWKVVEQKFFLMSVRNFCDYSSLKFLSLKFSHSKTLQPNLHADISAQEIDFHRKKSKNWLSPPKSDYRAKIWIELTCTLVIPPYRIFLRLQRFGDEKCQKTIWSGCKRAGKP
jgi:hypothetical protein